MLRKNGTPISFELVCEGLQFPEGPIALADGSIVIVEIARGTLTRIAPDGKATVAADLGAGPNGAAIGPDGAVYVCNHGGFVWHREPGMTRVTGTPPDFSGGRIERVDLRTGKFERLYDRCGEQKLNGPNDLVFDRHGGFYFTDHGKHYARHIDRGAVYYARHDGSMIAEVIFPISMPNGIGLSPDEQVLYVNETETGRCWGYQVLEPGKVERLPIRRRTAARCSTAPAAHPASTASNARRTAARLHRDIAERRHYHSLADRRLCRARALPDRIRTDLCFAGSDMKTMYVTLSSSGRLIKLNWPRAGARASAFVDKALV